jgi:hypothetical protein
MEMKAISVFPGKPNSVQVADLPKPSIDQVPNGRGVLVKVLRVSVLVLASVTGGDKMIQIPADRINLEFVLGNKSWSAP